MSGAGAVMLSQRSRRSGEHYQIDHHEETTDTKSYVWDASTTLALVGR